MKKIISLVLLMVSMAFGEPKAILDAQIAEALKTFDKEIAGGSNFLAKSKGYLVFPEVIKAGFVIGGEYGEGVLIENMTSMENNASIENNASTENNTSSENNTSIEKVYYSMTSASIGFQAGAQKTTYVIVFTTEQALNAFKASNGIEGSVDGSVAISKWGAGNDISSLSFEKPIIMFAFSQKGLMYNLNVKGTKFQKIVK